MKIVLESWVEWKISFFIIFTVWPLIGWGRKIVCFEDFYQLIVQNYFAIKLLMKNSFPVARLSVVRHAKRRKAEKFSFCPFSVFFLFNNHCCIYYICSRIWKIFQYTAGCFVLFSFPPPMFLLLNARLTSSIVLLPKRFFLSWEEWFYLATADSGKTVTIRFSTSTRSVVEPWLAR